MTFSEKANTKANAQKLTIDQKMGALSAILMPLIEIAALGFGTYVFVYSLCINYLLHPSSDFQEQGVAPRKSTAIGLITVFCLLLFILLLTWMRLLQVIWTNPGLVPLGDSSTEKQDMSWKGIEKYDAFISDYDGNPQFCDKCHNWKPDRTHHCRELGRCVKRMDHYCPWAGGIISETTHKFFIQFVFYGAIFTAFMLIPLAYFLAERIRKLGSKPATWIVAVALAALFCLFTGIMFFMTFWNLSINYTTIETVQRGGVVNITMLAARGSPTKRRASRASRASTASRRRDGPAVNVLREVSRDGGREYVVFQTQPFDHPWDLGSWENIRSVMGESAWEWFVPLRMSPCVRHEDPRGEYAWSRVVRDMATDWQLDNPGRQIHLLNDSGRNDR